MRSTMAEAMRMRALPLMSPRTRKTAGSTKRLRRWSSLRRARRCLRRRCCRASCSGGPRWLGPKICPKWAGGLGPVFKSTVRGTFKLAQKSKEAFAEAQEHVSDIVAEVKAEDADGLRAANKPRSAA